jgi:predicted MPP superfamily phosphohydrolase
LVAGALGHALPEYVDGWIDGFLQRGNHLFVNRGIGFSKLPVRIGAPPELTLITIHRA